MNQDRARVTATIQITCLPRRDSHGFIEADVRHAVRALVKGPVFSAVTHVEVFDCASLVGWLVVRDDFRDWLIRAA